MCSGHYQNTKRPKTETATECARASNRKTIIDLSQKTELSLCIYFNIFTRPSIWRFPSSFLFLYIYTVYIYIYSRLVSVPVGWECLFHYAWPSSCFMWRLWSPCTLISIKSGFSTSLPFSSFRGSFLRLQKWRDFVKRQLLNVFSDGCEMNVRQQWGGVWHIIGMQLCSIIHNNNSIAIAHLSDNLTAICSYFTRKLIWMNFYSSICILSMISSVIFF